MSFGVGAFPFGLFQTTFTTNHNDYHYAPRKYFDSRNPILSFSFQHHLAHLNVINMIYYPEYFSALH
jgi:hypothetical protein